MWDNVTEIKCNILGKVWPLKDLFFFECFYFSEYDIRMLLFVFWLRNRPYVTYLRNWRNGREFMKIVYRCVQGEGSWKIGHKIRTYEMDSPKIILWNTFCALVQSSRLEHTASNKNIDVFFDHNYDYFILCDNWSLVSFFYNRISTKNRHSTFLKEVLTQMFV